MALIEESDVIAYVERQLPYVADTFDQCGGWTPLSLLMCGRNPQTGLPVVGPDTGILAFDAGDHLDAAMAKAYFDVLRGAARAYQAYGCLIVTEAILANVKEPGQPKRHVVAAYLEHRRAGSVLWVAEVQRTGLLAPATLGPFERRTDDPGKKGEGIAAGILPREGVD